MPKTKQKKKAVKRANRRALNTAHDAVSENPSHANIKSYGSARGKKGTKALKDTLEK